MRSLVSECDETPLATSARSSGRFQWNAGGWFGSIVGSTLWMLVTAGFLLAHDQPKLAGVPIACFAVVNIIALVTWFYREHLDPYRSLMVMLGLIAIAVPIAWISVSTFGSQKALAAMNWPQSPFWNVAVLLIVPALMAWFYVIERNGNKPT